MTWSVNSNTTAMRTSLGHTQRRPEQALDYFDQQWVWLQSTDGCGSALLARQVELASQIGRGRAPGLGSNTTETQSRTIIFEG